MTSSATSMRSRHRGRIEIKGLGPMDIHLLLDEAG